MRCSKPLVLSLAWGAVPNVIGDSVQFYWDIVSQGTIAEGAQLHFEHVPATLRCLGCGRRSL